MIQKDLLVEIEEEKRGEENNKSAQKDKDKKGDFVLTPDDSICLVQNDPEM